MRPTIQRTQAISQLSVLDFKIILAAVLFILSLPTKWHYLHMQVHELGHSIPAFPGFPGDTFPTLCELHMFYAF